MWNPSGRADNRIPARIAVIGVPAPLGAADRRLPLALDQIIETVAIAGESPVRQQARVLRDGARAITQARCEAVHLFHPGFAPAARLLRARYGVPISATVDSADFAGGGAMRRANRRLRRRFDQLFSADPAAPALAQEAGVRLPIAAVPAVAAIPVEPSASDLRNIDKRLRPFAPERLVVGMPWPADAEQVRWYRDAVAPLLHGSPICLLLGSPGGRRVRLLTGAMGVHGGLRAHSGRLTASVIASAARYVDLFALPANPSGRAPLPEVLLALAASGVPAVIGGGVQSDVLLHERDCLAVDPGDAMGLVSVLNQALALPSQQRHQLGYDFAAHALARWTPEAAAAAYAERLAVLVGRPQIPAELRAAA